MNSVNASTGFSGFQLLHGRRPRVIPPLMEQTVQDLATTDADVAHLAERVICQIDVDTMEAQDNLTLAKTTQAYYANRARGEEIVYNVGDDVLLSTLHRRRDYMQRGDNQVAKFMVRFDGPYKVTKAHPETSSYTLDLPPSMKIFPTFHAWLLKPYIRNDDGKWPGRKLERPGPVVGDAGEEEWFVEKLLDKRRCGRGWRFYVRWRGYRPEADSWIPGSEAVQLEAYDAWEKEEQARAALEEEQSGAVSGRGKGGRRGRR